MLHDTPEYLTLAQVAMFTGLTDRCIRMHIEKGYLMGEKVGGAWRFTPEQVGEYFQHPAVKPSIIARKNSVVYDFVMDTYKKESQVCFILDIPSAEEAEAAAEFFLREMNSEQYKGMRYSFSNLDGMPRVLLTGDAQNVLAMVSKYHAEMHA
ncbi:MAG: helix-turn-helix domain-containing protein [Clostridia bacterium]|nr:helix-turn-helix domain-containing protein [Clostridia bacterium]